MSTDITAPNEGSATAAREIANELNRACECLRTVDYNALTPQQLGEVLEAYRSLNNLCHHFRKRQTRERDRDGGGGEEDKETAPDTANSREITVEVADDAPATVREAVVDGGELLLVDTITDTPEFVGNGEIALVATVADSESNDPESEVSDDV